MFPVLLRFNPTLVRLKPGKEGPHEPHKDEVSIPRWFD